MGDELVEVTEEVGPVAKGVAEDEVIVVTHHDELVELDAVLGGAVGEAVLKNLAGVGVRSQEKLPPGASPRTEDDVAGGDLSGSGHGRLLAVHRGSLRGSGESSSTSRADPAETTLGRGAVGSFGFLR